MDLYYFETAAGNFGDDLNHWLWDEILPGWRDMLPDHLLVGVGTLINGTLPRGRPKLILGSGVGYGGLPDAELMAECRFVAVRGPRSAAALGLPAERGIVDPAVMIADLAAFQGIARKGRPVFVPHHASVGLGDWEAMCNRAGVDYVSPMGEAGQVIRRLAAAPLVITESMHGAILADAFGTPWHAVTISPRILKSKWMDWAESLGVEFDMTSLFPAGDWLASRFPQKRRKSPRAAMGGGAGQQAAHGPGNGPMTRRQRLQQTLLAMELPLATMRLRRIAGLPGNLSDRARLEEAKARFRSALAEGVRDVR